MNIPTDYKPGYEKARAIKSDIADNYIAHTHIGGSAEAKRWRKISESEAQKTQGDSSRLL